MDKKEALFMFIIFVVGIIGVIAFNVWVSTEERQISEAEARCKSLGGERGYLKCYKNGKEV